jgi:transcriptional regulator with XRE-family HTH domain
MPANLLGQKISALLKESGLKQSDLAHILGISRASVNSWILGKHAPSSEKLKQIADLFKIHLSWFRDDRALYPPDKQYLADRVRPGSVGHPGKLETNPFRKNEGQAVEAISRNLFRVNNHDLQLLLSELQQISDQRDSRRVLELFGKFFKFIEKETGKRDVKVHLLRRRGMNE